MGWFKDLFKSEKTKQREAAEAKELEEIEKQWDELLSSLEKKADKEVSKQIEQNKRTDSKRKKAEDTGYRERSVSSTNNYSYDPVSVSAYSSYSSSDSGSSCSDSSSSSCD